MLERHLFGEPGWSRVSKILSEESQKIFRAVVADPEAFLKSRFPGITHELLIQNIVTRALGYGLNCPPKCDYVEALTPVPQNGTLFGNRSVQR